MSLSRYQNLNARAENYSTVPNQNREFDSKSGSTPEIFNAIPPKKAIDDNENNSACKKGSTKTGLYWENGVYKSYVDRCGLYSSKVVHSTNQSNDETLPSVIENKTEGGNPEEIKDPKKEQQKVDASPKPKEGENSIINPSSEEVRRPSDSNTNNVMKSVLDEKNSSYQSGAEQISPLSKPEDLPLCTGDEPGNQNSQQSEENEAVKNQEKEDKEIQSKTQDLENGNKEDNQSGYAASANSGNESSNVGNYKADVNAEKQPNSNNLSTLSATGGRVSDYLISEDKLKKKATQEPTFGKDNKNNQENPREKIKDISSSKDDSKVPECIPDSAIDSDEE